MNVKATSTRSRTPPAPDDGTQHVNRNLLIAGGMLAATIAVVWAIRSQGEPAMVERETRAALVATQDATWPVPAGPRQDAAAPTAAQAPPQDSGQQFASYVDDKYRNFYRDSDAAHLGTLRAALMDREHLVAQLNTAKQSADDAARQSVPGLEARKAGLDRNIESLLPPGQLASFEAQKDADIERFQLEDYAGGISNVAPLNEADKQAILTTKLASRERFKRVLADSRLMSGDLNGTERLLAFNEVSRALKDYQQNYLQEVRQYIYNDEQYSLLTNYENTEYDAELAKLRAIAGLD